MELIFCATPNPKDIIYISFIGKQIGFISGDYFVFVTCKKQVCIITCRWCTHGSSVFLEPERISELEDVVLHHDSECFGQGVSWDVCEVGFSLHDEGGDFMESGGRANVGVHSRSVGDEEACIGW